MVGMKPTSVNNYLNGTKTCTLELVARTLEIFKEISAEWLLRGEGAMIKGEVKSDDAVRKELADVKARNNQSCLLFFKVYPQVYRMLL